MRTITSPKPIIAMLSACNRTSIVLWTCLVICSILSLYQTQTSLQQTLAYSNLEGEGENVGTDDPWTLYRRSSNASRSNNHNRLLPTSTSTNTSTSVPSSSTYSTSLECKIAYDTVRFESAKQWATRGLPNFGGVKELPNQQEVYIFMDQDMTHLLTHKKMDREFQTEPWLCLYEQDNPWNVTDPNWLWPELPPIENATTTRYIKSSRPKYNRRKLGVLTFVLKCPSYNANGESVRGIVATHGIPVKQKEEQDGGVDDRSNTSTTITSMGHAYYNLTHVLECDRLEHRQDDIILKQRNITVGVCIHFFGPGPRKTLWPWVEYHRMLGVEHFWFYQHEAWNMTGLPQNKPYVTYEPYDWPERTYRKHWSHFPWQENMRHNCVFRAKRLGIPWVLGTDPDEYLHITRNMSSSTSSDTPLLHQFLSDYQNVGALQLRSVPYGINLRERPPPTPEEPLLNYSIWRKNQSLEAFGWGRTKMIYNASSTWSLGMHYMWAADGPTHKLSATNEAYVQHHTQSAKGVTQGGHKKRFEKNGELMQDTRVKDAYLQPVQQALEREYGQTV